MTPELKAAAERVERDMSLYHRDHAADLRLILAALAARQWRSIETAPPPLGDEPILAICHDVWTTEGLHPEEAERLAPYMAASEYSNGGNGPRVLEWGADGDGNECWFECGSDFERPGNPVFWQPLPEPPQEGVSAHG